MTRGQWDDRIFVIDKEPGPTSFDVVERFRRATRVRRVGHTGTLDPLARGVLLLCTGRATRAVEHFMDMEKEYEFDVRLGEATTTLDAEGDVTEAAPVPDLPRERLDEAAASFVGPWTFRPPAFSAIKQRGRRLYDLARSGQAAEPPERTVTIHALEVVAWESPHVTLRARCSRGTYVRSLGAAFGERLGLPAHVSGLVRRRVGPFTLEQAFPSRRVFERDLEGLEGIPIDAALSFLPAFVLRRAAARALIDGAVPEPGDAVDTQGRPRPGGAARLVDEAGRLLAVGRCPGDVAGSRLRLVESFRLYVDPVEYRRTS